MKKYWPWAVGAFLLYWLATNPNGFSAALTTVMNGLGAIAHGLSTALSGLVGKH